MNFNKETEDFKKLQTEIMELKISISSSTKDYITHKKKGSAKSKKGHLKSLNLKSESSLRDQQTKIHIEERNDQKAYSKK